MERRLAERGVDLKEATLAEMDALWDEADLDDVELDSQALEIAQAPLFDDSDEDDPLF